MYVKGLLALVAVAACFLFTYFIHDHLLASLTVGIRDLLKEVYIFLFVCTLIIGAFFIGSAHSEKILVQAGFIYLIALGLKLFLFVLAFYQFLFVEDTATELQKIHFLVPVFLGLTAEIIILQGILKRVDWKS